MNARSSGRLVRECPRLGKATGYSPVRSSLPSHPIVPEWARRELGNSATRGHMSVLLDHQSDLRDKEIVCPMSLEELKR
jgi:hypothetical protein